MFAQDFFKNTKFIQLDTKQSRNKKVHKNIHVSRVEAVAVCM